MNQPDLLLRESPNGRRVHTWQEHHGYSESMAPQAQAAIEQYYGDAITGVSRGSLHADQAGGDWIVDLRGGRPVVVEVKNRKPGCSKYWPADPKLRPELALEVWSRKPQGTFEGSIGWTLDRKKKSELVLFMFDPSDYHHAIFVPFQPLRHAFSIYLNEWMARYPGGNQLQERCGEAQNVFVPEREVWAAIHRTSRFTPLPLRQ